MILAGDIGGTKTHLALFPLSGKLVAIQEKTYPSKKYETFSEIAKLFLLSYSKKIDYACFGIAGPVEKGKCHATNLPWVVDVADLKRDLKIPNVWLINDLNANAYGIQCLKKNEFFSLNEGTTKGMGNQALISAGTGLGEAGLYWDGEKHHPFACEGGHADFAPRDDLELDLFRYLRQKFDHVSYERVLSGPGLYNLYRFLIDTRLEEESSWTKEEMAKEDPPRVITRKAIQKECKACMRTLDWFVSIYGSEAGNLALKYLATGGLYIGGGIAPKILSALQSGIFMKSFIAKGRMASLLSHIPVRIVLNENTALMGAAEYVKEKI